MMLAGTAVVVVVAVAVAVGGGNHLPSLAKRRLVRLCLE